MLSQKFFRDKVYNKSIELRPNIRTKRIIPKATNHWVRNRFDRRGVYLTLEAFDLPGRPLPFCCLPGCSSGRRIFRDERVACCDEDSSLGPGSIFAAFAVPLVTRRAEISAEFESVVVTGHPGGEAEMSVFDGQADGFTTVIGPGLINRGSIFVISKSTEEAGVSVPCRFSDSVDVSLEEPSRWLARGLSER